MGIDQEFEAFGRQSALRQSGIEDPSLLACRILIVEPNEDSALLVKSLLELAGYTGVEVLPSYETALKSHSYEAFDLILIHATANGAEGLGTIQALQALEPAFLPVMVMISEADQRTCQAFLRAGVREFVTKPVDGTALRLRVRNMLDMMRLNRIYRSTAATG